MPDVCKDQIYMKPSSIWTLDLCYHLIYVKNHWTTHFLTYRFNIWKDLYQNIKVEIIRAVGPIVGRRPTNESPKGTPREIKPGGFIFASLPL